jgi:phosphoglycolate phosphatase
VSNKLAVNAVIFDLDGTLLDTADDIAEGANRMLEDLGRPRLEVGQVRAYIGNGVSRLVKRALTGAWDGEPEKALFNDALPLFQKHYEEVLTRSSHPYPGVMEGVAAMKQAGYRLACVTNKAARFTEPLLVATGLAPFFELTVSGDTLPKKKPDPLPLLHICAHFGTRPEHALLIGDSLNDSVAARAAGCPVFLVPYGYNGGRDVREQDSDAVIGRLTDALDLIEKNHS